MNLRPPTESRSNPESPFYTFKDLQEWDSPGTWLAVVGYPVRHSLSPPMHEAALHEITRTHPEYASWKYVGFEIPPEQFADALPLFFDKGFYGLNLTLPHKIQAMDLVGDVDPEALRMGAVNTLVHYESGYRGFNTDGYGLRAGLQAELDVECRGRDVVLLGAGGASRAAAVQCLKDGCRTLWIGNRTRSRLDALIAALEPELRGERVQPFDLMAPPTELPREAVLINATSAGLHAEDPLPIALDGFVSDTVVYDMIYNPQETRLVAEARSRGMRAATGLSMLVHQGARSLEIWTQVPVSADAMTRAAADALKKR